VTDRLLEELRRAPLLEQLSDAQLAELVAKGEEVAHPAGTVLLTEGAPSTGFYILLEGEIRVTRQVGGVDVVVGETAAAGAWAGLVPYVYEESPAGFTLTRDSRLFRTDDDVLRDLLDRGLPIAKHLLLGVTFGTDRFRQLVADRERLAALGRLSAGLAHELNNPAAAIARAADRLQAAVASHEAAALDVACAAPDPGLVERLASVRAAIEAAMGAPFTLSPLDRNDREDELADWLEDAGLEEGAAAAAGLVDAGFDAAAVDALVPPDGPARVPMLRWLVAATETAALLREVASAGTRISDLVGSVKQYSYMDRAPEQEIDVRRGLEDTLAVLADDLQGIAVERRYDPDLPAVVGQGGQLNQVWTNLLENAADALGHRGTIRLSATVEEGAVVVRVQDDGPGIPEELRARIFEPFFTTKGVGEGTGLGLDLARRIVTRDFGGELSVTSEPGSTTFTVALPLPET
jgi:signal transduction histidine kinase